MGTQTRKKPQKTHWPSPTYWMPEIQYLGNTWHLFPLATWHEWTRGCWRLKFTSMGQQWLLLMESSRGLATHLWLCLWSTSGLCHPLLSQTWVCSSRALLFCLHGHTDKERALIIICNCAFPNRLEAAQLEMGKCPRWRQCSFLEAM